MSYYNNGLIDESKVRPEFRGKQKLFFQRVEADHHALDQLVTSIHKQVHQRWSRKPNSPIRRDTLLAFAKQWPKIGQFGRLELRVDLQPKHLRITDIRLIPSTHQRVQEWPNLAPSLGIGFADLMIGDTADATEFHFRTYILLLLGEHCIGRFYERCDHRHRKDIYLKHAIYELILQSRPILDSEDVPDGTQFELLTSVGAWLGQKASLRVKINREGKRHRNLVLQEEDRTVLQVRTYLPDPREEVIDELVEELYPPSRIMLGPRPVPAIDAINNQP